MATNNRAQTKLELINDLVKELEIKNYIIREDTTVQEDLGADSLRTINTNLVIAKRLGVQMADEPAFQFVVVRDIVDNLVGIGTWFTHPAYGATYPGKMIIMTVQS